MRTLNDGLRMRANRYAAVSIGLVLAVYGVSFFLPAVASPNLLHGEPTIGAVCFVEAMRSLPFTICWFANPLLRYGIYALATRRWLAGWGLGLGALFLGLCVNFRDRYYLGYVLWLTSMGLMALLSLLGNWIVRDPRVRSVSAR